MTLAYTGIRAVKLEELERRLRNDLTQEAMIWGSRVLVHREMRHHTGTAGVTRAGTPSASHSPSRSPSLQHLTPIKRRLELEGELQTQTSDDVTKKEEGTEAEQLVAYWEGTGARPAGSC